MNSKKSFALAVAGLALTWAGASRADETTKTTTIKSESSSTTAAPTAPPTSTTATWSSTTTTDTSTPSTPSTVAPAPASTETGSSTSINIIQPAAPPVVVPVTVPSQTTTTTSGSYYPPFNADTERDETIRPNRPLIFTGLVLFGGTYAASAAVAATSRANNSEKADDYLWIPVAGPWIDMGNRECNFRQCTSREDWNNALLIGSGVLQGVGVGMMAASLFVPEHHKVGITSTAKADKPHVTVVPASVGVGGTGAMAVGTF